ncbi:hypothetical protein VCHC17A1_1208B, partial [Vibrio cholerae HC-17A1]
NKTCRYYQR